VEEDPSDPKDVSITYLPGDLLVNNDNSELRCKVESVLDYLRPPYHYTEDTKSRISNILDQVLDIMQAEAGRVLISNDCVECEILSAEAINEKIERPPKEFI
jgi:hypothetical protein